MAEQRERPCVASNFVVDLGGGRGGGRAGGAGTGFFEVVFPVFRADTAHPRPEGNPPAAEHLILRRGATGALDLYAWWDQARRGKAPQRRTVRVDLLSEDQATVVMSWRFRNVRPVNLSYSPLNASAASVLMETLELGFDGVDML
jgi:hypothetical protein